MKNKLFFIVIFIILILTYIGRLYYISNTSNTVFNHIFPSMNNINSQLIKNYFSSNEEIKKDAENMIKEIVLKDINYENWIDYIEYIDIAIYPIDIIGDKKEDLIITLNVSKDIGVLAIYKPFNNNYIFTSKIENLTYINKVTTLRNIPLGKSFIIVEQTLDEKLGAFFFDNYVQIFVNNNNSFTEVFKQSLNYEGYYYEKWSDPSLEKPKWIKLIEQSLVDYITDENNNILINITKSIFKYEGYNYGRNTIPENFQLIKEENLKIKYFWSKKYSYFIQYEGRVNASNTPVGIIEYSGQFADSLLGLYKPYYKVIHKNGKIEYINSNELTIIENYVDEHN